MGKKVKMRTVVFFRKEGWYTIETPVNDDLDHHAKINPGTLKIEDTKGNILWQGPESLN